jgi:hypothetical protein
MTWNLGLGSEQSYSYTESMKERKKNGYEKKE